MVFSIIFIQFVSTQFDKNIKIFRSGHGTEFVNKNVAHFFLNMRFSTKKHVFTHHNKIKLLKEDIEFCLLQQEP